jgi:Uma2 family endonuclease
MGFFKNINYLGNICGMWVDRKQRKVFIYRSQLPLEELDHPLTLSGENVLPGFILDLSQIW